MTDQNQQQADCEYIVVGSGAGGGTVAARLAEAGRKVVLLEAGGDPKELTGGDMVGKEGRLPCDYDVPAFHAFASENEAMKWDFFVRHYTDDQLQRLDPKYSAEYGGKPVDGVLYPRAGTLGGCTAHNAMILIYPHNADWDYIAELTGDASWKAGNMRAYFERIENCHHRRLHRWLAKIGFNPTRHGWKGWLRTEKSIPMSAMRNRTLAHVMLASGHEAFDDIGEKLKRVRWLFQGQLDPNDWRLVERDSIGLRYVPLSTSNRARTGSRERVLEVACKYPDRLRVELNALATRVLFDDTNRAVGVEYLKGERLYRAHMRPSDGRGELRRMYASREVILAGGAFNTPQLLMLSGIGPKEHLAEYGIACRADRPGVGRNLQDRYEVGVVSTTKRDFAIRDGATFKPPLDGQEGDACFQEWLKGVGMYTSNGAIVALITRSARSRPDPDLFLFALPGNFHGYYPGYSADIERRKNYLTWAVLKAHTNNTSGEVRLLSADPRRRPYINFHYFDQSTDPKGEDLDAVVNAVMLVQQMNRRNDALAEELIPGPGHSSRAELAKWVTDNTWGHHASCSARIGRPDDRMAVVDSRFRVIGTTGLRVVDASVFPRIPGFFIVTPIYMISEKAADVISEDANSAG